VSRYGAKLPLIVGPIIAALGFALFMRPGLGGSFWLTFFPAMVVLGLGRRSASRADHHRDECGERKAAPASLRESTTRSRARAGQLAVAVFGLIMLHAFNHALDRA